MSGKNIENPLKIQGDIIKKLQEEIIIMRTTGIVKPFSQKEMKTRAFKEFIGNNVDLTKYANKKYKEENKELKQKQVKTDKILKRNHLDMSKKNLEITENGYIRKAKFFNVQEMLDNINIAFNQGKVYYSLPGGYQVRTDSLRYRTFVNNLVCVSCGLKGFMLCVEKGISDKEGREGKVEGHGYHLNLYAFTSEGKEVLMTKDHIRPKSLGGPDHLDNMQTMCTRCNNKKGNTYNEQDLKCLV